MKGKDFFSQVSGKPPFSRMHPQVAAFKTILLRRRWCDLGINTF